ncbi:MAG: segregation/condensation protein A [Lachnospiraceae bacterium]|nr:segregation/condensation protein A [Lachnospiraceae bacterium]
MALKVELQAFDGPLDLLLHLIEKNKVNIFDIPIVEITEQYLDYVRQMETEDLNVMSEFMVMAADLISIKCRMLLPPEVDEEGEEIDPRDDLVRQLLEYKVYKYMSFELREKMALAAKHYFKPNTTPASVLKYRPEVSPEELLADTTLAKLHDIFRAVMKRQTDKLDPVRSKFGDIKKEEVHLKDRIDYILAFTTEHESYSFKQLLTENDGTMSVIVTFLCILQMIRDGVLNVSQEEVDGDILLTRTPDADLSRVTFEDIDEPSDASDNDSDDGNGFE